MWSLYTRGIQKLTRSSSFGKYFEGCCFKNKSTNAAANNKAHFKATSVVLERIKMKTMRPAVVYEVSLARRPLDGSIPRQMNRKTSCSIPEKQIWANADKTWLRWNHKYGWKLGGFYPHTPSLFWSYFPTMDFSVQNLPWVYDVIEWISRHQWQTHT